MRILTTLTFILLTSLMTNNSAYGQNTPSEKGSASLETWDFKGHEISGGYIIINYHLPYSGMVEFRLFDNEGNKVWQNQYTNNLGDNRIVLRASKLTPGKTYAYQMVYKKNMVMQNLEVPSNGTE